jgi:hypothetical protein
MKKQIVTLHLFAIAFTGFSQSKKEQIEVLNYRIDSLNQIITSKQIALSAKEKEIFNFQSQITKFEETLSNKEKELNKNAQTISKLENENDILNFSIDTLNKRIKTLQLAANKILINNNGITGIKVGDKLSSIPQDYFVKKTYYYDNEGEQNPKYELSKNGIVELEVYPNWIDQTGEYGDLIEEIIIFSKSLKTETGIGVGNTLEQFANSYPQYTLWYTYVSDRFLIDTDNLKNIQFSVSQADFIGEKDKLGNSDMDLLKIGQFKNNTQITSIRIF